jgi:hypothetical protein
VRGASWRSAAATRQQLRPRFPRWNGGHDGSPGGELGPPPGRRGVRHAVNRTHRLIRVRPLASSEQCRQALLREGQCGLAVEDRAHGVHELAAIERFLEEVRISLDQRVLVVTGDEEHEGDLELV